MFRAPPTLQTRQFGQMQIGGGRFSAAAEPNTPEFNALKAKRAQLQEQMKTIPRSIRGGSNEFGQNPMPAMGLEGGYGPKYNPTQQEIDDLARYKSILTQQNIFDDAKPRRSSPRPTRTTTRNNASTVSRQKSETPTRI